MSHFFEFVQFEFTHAIGPHAGRYVISPDAKPDDGAAAPIFESGDVDDVLLFDDTGRRNTTGATRTLGIADILVISFVEAEPAKFRWGRSKKIEAAVTGAAPGLVPLLLATYIRATQPIDQARRAQEELEHLSVDLEGQLGRINEGLDVLNRAVRAYRIAAGDPYVTEVGRRNARAVRLGYGSTDEVADGRWTAAFVVPQPNIGRTKRSDRLRPGETTARILSGRSEVLEAEDLLLRTMTDLDHGRSRAAAMQAHAALSLLERELPEPEYQQREDRSVSTLAERARELASEATRGDLSNGQLTEIEEILEAAELQINRWRYPAR